MREVEKMTYAGRYPEKLRELMARWNLSEFETAKRVVQTYYTNVRAVQEVRDSFDTFNSKEVFRIFDCIQDAISEIQQGVKYQQVDLRSGNLRPIETTATLELYADCY